MGGLNLFQSQVSQESELCSILEQELNFFNSVLEFSKKFVEEIESMPVNVLSNMVNFRQNWVEKIQKLEEKRKTIQLYDSDSEAKDYLKQISEVASKLVSIDKRIYKNLQDRKIKYVKNHSDTAAQARSFSKQAEFRKGNSNRVDIIQE